MAIISSNLIAALCRSQYGAVDPGCEAPPPQAPRIDGQGAAASVGGDLPSISSSPRVEARTLARHLQERDQENGDRRAAGAPRARRMHKTPSLPLSTAHSTSSGVEVQRSISLSDVLSLHYRDRIPSRSCIPFVPGATSCNKAVAYILLFSVEHSPIEAPRAHAPATDV
ncbi:hypothetical protein AURDEDRAFT_178700 [Auricularia subglabra TFB-10046 SS5]|uniref:Uncharacterized protein n=1 Tax=Auricularia subglabra (strain TFB-10046 / SS5) TaxID=717982 RepID=J0L7G5_AURST|nr:hypothetical protein AURDEDRAFT_178700 [Auricularia subglabra TFB-10046 SS5]